MYLGDNLLRDGITELVESFRHDEHDALLLLTQVPDPWHYGVAELVFWLEVGGPVAAVVWLPAGVGIAALYLGGPRLWPGVRPLAP